MAMVVGGLALLIITIVGVIQMVVRRSLMPQGFFEYAAGVVVVLVGLFIFGVLTWVITRIIHRWAQLMGGG